MMTICLAFPNISTVIGPMYGPVAVGKALTLIGESLKLASVSSTYRGVGSASCSANAIRKCYRRQHWQLHNSHSRCEQVLLQT